MAYLILSDGEIYEGVSFGAQADVTGELVFTTGMEGYIETLTDPSYAGQIVIQTFPMIGNYGIIEEDFEGRPALNGYIVREACTAPSNFRCDCDLDTFLKKNGIPGICGLDTRALTQKIRKYGVMNARIVQELPDKTADICSYTVSGAVKQVSRTEKEVFPAENEEKFSVVLIDYGAKNNIIRSLTGRGCTVTAVPYDTPAADILAMAPDGVMLSNGPGDPAENTYSISQIKELIGKIPVFGICLGHQLTALAMGGKTIKLKFGHRGGNQPVREVKGTRTYITSQNHGYAVDPDSMHGIGEITYVNANDGSCEGIDYPGKMCFTVQFHPEACSGPHDTSFLFDRFIKMMGDYNA